MKLWTSLNPLDFHGFFRHFLSTSNIGKPVFDFFDSLRHFYQHSSNIRSTPFYQHFHNFIWIKSDAFYLLDEHIKIALVVLDGSDVKLDLVDGGDDGRVISAEYLSYLLERQIGKLSDYINRNVSCARYAVGFLFRLDVVDRNTVLFAHVEQYFFYHSVVGNIAGINDRDNVVDGLLCYLKTGEGMDGIQLLEYTLNLSDVVVESLGNIVDKAGGNGKSHVIRLFLDYRCSQLEGGGLNVCDKTPLKSGTKSVHKGIDLLGWTVGGEYNQLF